MELVSPDAIDLEMWREPLHRFLYRITGDVALAQDCVQEAFATVFERRRHIDWTRPVKNLLYTIGLNAARKALRRPPRVPQRAANAADPAETAILEESARQVESAVLSLPEDQREVVVLYFYERLIYREIAEVLEAPLGTIKWRMHEAMARLRPRLVELADGMR